MSHDMYGLMKRIRLCGFHHLLSIVSIVMFEIAFTWLDNQHVRLFPFPQRLALTSVILSIIIHV